MSLNSKNLKLPFRSTGRSTGGLDLPVDLPNKSSWTFHYAHHRRLFASRKTNHRDDCKYFLCKGGGRKNLEWQHVPVYSSVLGCWRRIRWFFAVGLEHNSRQKNTPYTTAYIRCSQPDKIPKNVDTSGSVVIIPVLEKLKSYEKDLL